MNRTKISASPAVAFVLVAVLSLSCKEVPKGGNTELPTQEKPRAEAIIDSSVAFHAGDAYEKMSLSFNFRGTIYDVERRDGHFTYTAQFSDSLGNHRRELSNAGYREYLDGSLVSLTSEDSAKRAGSVNSVVYFVLLPAPLRDAAVRSEYLGTESLDGKPYFKVRVAFGQEGGGADHEDVYLYWFDKHDYSMDYLAYSFHVNEGGSRFRRAFDPRRLNGFLFQDYVNYRGPADPDSLASISELYRSGRLDSLSTVAIDSLRFLAVD